LEHAWRLAGCYVCIVWTPWQCCCMWPLSVAVEGGRCWRIRWGVRPGLVVSLELHGSAQRSVGVGGKHNTWCIKRAWSLAMEVAATMAAMSMRGNAVVGRIVGGLLVGVSSTATQNCAASMRNSTSNLCEEDLAPLVAECHHTNEGV
jgi:hypothetical protein